MPTETILACLTSPDTAASVLRAAVLLARRTDAHLIGLHARESALVYAQFGMHMPTSMIVEFDRAQDERAEAIRAIFDASTRAEASVCEWRLERSDTGSAIDRILESSRAADIVILPKPDPETDRGAEHELAEQVIRNSGRPVLVVPKGFDGDHIGQTLVIGWSGTREAARAGHDALQLAERGAEAILLTVSRGTYPDPRAENTVQDMAASLSRHGLRPTICQRTADGAGVATVMTREALERGADLIVTGAFGHSAVYDFVMGAATRELLADAEIPVLFSK